MIDWQTGISGEIENDRREIGITSSQTEKWYMYDDCIYLSRPRLAVPKQIGMQWRPSINWVFLKFVVSVVSRFCVASFLVYIGNGTDKRIVFIYRQLR